MSEPVSAGRNGVEGGAYQRRYKWLILCGFLGMCFIIGRLWFIQVLGGERYWRSSTENIIRDVEIKPARGRIYDTNGVVLADNRPSFDVVLSPGIFKRAFRKKPKAEQARALGLLKKILNLTPERMTRVEKVLDRKHPPRELVVVQDATRQQVAELETEQLRLPGVEVIPRAHRTYPLHEVGAHLVGFMGEISSTELADLKGYGYRVGDYIGRMGLESAFEQVLRGVPGIERQVIGKKGERRGEAETRFLIGEYQHVKPISGRDLVLTVDTELMLIIRDAMKSYPSGAVVALDPRDGSVLALFSKPGFNPNSWTGRLSQQEKLRHDNNPFKPMIDKTVNAYFPGSVYKIAGSLAALEAGMKPEDEHYCRGSYRFGGRAFRCWKHAGHKEVNVIKALAESCDVYYYRVAEELGIDKLAEVAYRFGFGEATGVPINHESPGRVPTKEWHRKVTGSFQYGFALNTVIGQGDTLTTPLQVALAYAAIANGGDLFYPRLIKEVRARDTGETLFRFSPQRRKRVEMKQEHLQAIRQGLWETVNTENGTAWTSRLDEPQIAGKTGTAQVHKIGQVRIANKDKKFQFRDHAWFAAYAPFDDPKFVIVVFLQHAGHGGSDAAPVAKKIIDAYFHRDPDKPRTARLSERAQAVAPGTEDMDVDMRSIMVEVDMSDEVDGNASARDEADMGGDPTMTPARQPGSEVRP